MTKGGCVKVSTEPGRLDSGRSTGLYARPVTEQGQASVGREAGWAVGVAWLALGSCIPMQNSKESESSKFKSSLLDHYKGAIVKAEKRNIFYLTLLAWFITYKHKDMWKKDHHLYSDRRLPNVRSSPPLRAPFFWPRHSDQKMAFAKHWVGKKIGSSFP